MEAAPPSRCGPPPGTSSSCAPAANGFRGVELSAPRVFDSASSGKIAGGSPMRSPIMLSALLASLSLPMLASECNVVDRLSGPYAFSVVASDTGFPADEDNTGAYLGVDIPHVTHEG